MGWGEYPAEYNRKVHGTYDPARWYGKPDTPFSQVKLGELGSWIGRRNKTPMAMVQEMSRGWWRWQHKWVNPWKASSAHLFQKVTVLMFAFWVFNYKKYQKHQLYKFH